MYTHTLTQTQNKRKNNTQSAVPIIHRCVIKAPQTYWLNTLVLFLMVLWAVWTQVGSPRVGVRWRLGRTHRNSRERSQQRCPRACTGPSCDPGVSFHGLGSYREHPKSKCSQILRWELREFLRTSLGSIRMLLLPYSTGQIITKANPEPWEGDSTLS